MLLLYLRGQICCQWGYCMSLTCSRTWMRSTSRPRRRPQAHMIRGIATDRLHFYSLDQLCTAQWQVRIQKYRDRNSSSNPLTSRKQNICFYLSFHFFPPRAIWLNDSRIPIIGPYYSIENFGRGLLLGSDIGEYSPILTAFWHSPQDIWQTQLD